ncbi:hypothetical protein A2810_01470 [candidate division Kazan bacterium RIFCSPHIGHO2_01_FULL_49_10]|uniref:Uncharacterized protein n=1 Tax=candidate division Kazan bacterium RIFCSPLOWO2_01_FULL_48_13 TaxID=1798539 RepID=A0A1F4PPA3_UNCK3|nr:MAG: hypothetical protein A2810_01470 [candidate division Kazan bacterium RIFCSPHIGHO2_01_FULL_49_10]OGB85484.1 MAG: hypothetical protein A2994_01460 [candidate division Kazan bacterium RIFCSPLOWO2_01_FULL_48_13]
MNLKKINRKKLLIGLGIALLLLLILWLWWSNRNPAGNPATEQDYRITQDQKAGEKSGYKIDISLDTVPLNPYPGSIARGKITVLNAQDKVATEVNGGVKLFVEGAMDFLRQRSDIYSYSETYKVAGSAIATDAEYHDELIGLTAGDWKRKEDGSNTYEFIPAIQEVTQLDLITYSNSAVSPCFDTKFGYDNAKAAWIANAWASAPGEYVMLTEGQGEFSYINLGRANPIKIIAIANEEPVYSTDSLKTIGSYQVIGTGSWQNYHYQNDIYTIATVPIGEFKKFSSPKPPSQRLEYVTDLFRTDKSDYYYEVTLNSKQLTGQSGEKLTMMIKPKALPGKTLPHTIHDTIKLKIEDGYTLSQPAFGVSYYYRHGKDWLKRNRLAYFSGYNDGGLADSTGQEYNPADDTPNEPATPNRVALTLNSAGDTMTVELTATSEQSVLKFIAIRLTAYDKSLIASANGRACVLGSDQIIGIPIKQ